MILNNYYRLTVQLLLVVVASCADLPTLYEYYTSDGISTGLSVDQPYFTLNGKNITIYSGAMHYFRIPPQYWRDRLKKLRASGLNTVETYIAWNIHEPIKGVFDFGEEDSKSDMHMFTNVENFISIAQEEDLLVIVRPGPFICAEWEFGGFPSWLLTENNITLRTSDPVYMNYVKRYFDKLLPIIAKYQFTKGGPIIAVQVENEYGFSQKIDLDYLQQLVDIIKDHDIVELLVTSDGASSRSQGSLLGVLFQTVNFGSDPGASFSILEEIQPNQPLMVMEFYPGWLDHWTENHHTQDNKTFITNFEATISYPASANLYMFHGGTNWGFFNGANNGPGDNSAFQPTTTSYDYDAPLNEAGDYTAKYYIIQDLIKQYNPIETLTPDPPELIERMVYPILSIDAQIKFGDIIENINELVVSSGPFPMEESPINQNSGQSYGYIIYEVEELDIPADSVLTITGHIRDTVMILIDHVLVSNPLKSIDDLNNFGYWRLENSSITLTKTDLTNVTLSIVVENWGRVNYGNIYTQFKGLTEDNQVYLNNKLLEDVWITYSLEFKDSWTTRLNNWTIVKDKEIQKGPALYKGTLTIADENPADTFLDMREWNKGVVMVNGFVLGRYAFIGPQQTLYLPGPFLQTGDNEIVIFEQFEPAAEIKFVKDAIFSNP